MTRTERDAGGGRTRATGLWLGPSLALGMLVLVSLEPGEPAVTRMAAVALWMAVWWITEAVPLAVTALLPVVLLPLLGIMPGRQVSPLYFNSIIFLFLGGFVVALAMERWALHRRIALGIILLVGGGPRRLVLGFMLAAGFLSMWISNTATTMMMIPIVLAVLGRVCDGHAPDLERRFPPALLLGTAYGASLGGLATLVGTPPNPLFVRQLAVLFPAAPEIGFARWLVFALPLSALMIAATWLLLCLFFRLGKDGPALSREVLRREREALGPLGWEERWVLAVFVLLATLWMTRTGLTVGSWTVPGWSSLLPWPDHVDDGTVAVAMALVLFLVPSRARPDTRIMDWNTARRLPWGIVLLFGGGFALASGFVESGLSAWLGGRLEGLSGLPPVLVVLSVCLLITFLTELTSNTATTQMVLPVLAAVAVAIRVDPLLLMVPATLSASCAFMLPVATPPNAIVFGTERIRGTDMARVGFVLNLLGAVLITACVYLVGRLVLDIDPAALPAWAQPG